MIYRWQLSGGRLSEYYMQSASQYSFMTVDCLPWACFSLLILYFVVVSPGQEINLLMQRKSSV